MGYSYGQHSAKNFPVWEPGFLDIHHINTGSGDSTFMIFPDGTTLLFDAGTLDKAGFETKYAPLRATAPVPNDSKSPSQWIAQYIEHHHPSLDGEPSLDYVLVSHFHSDHYGSIPELGRLVPMKKVIDRNFPHYDFPLDLKSYLEKDSLFQSYLNFISNEVPQVESLVVGSTRQIVPKKKWKGFSVLGLKSNELLWDSKKESSVKLFEKEEMLEFYKGKYNENPLSLAILVQYGDFEYFTGGDNTGLTGFGLPDWFDVETPIAQSIGNVEALTLNHHGNRDATNQYFVEKTDPQVAIQQLWCSDHPGQEVYQRLINLGDNASQRLIFSTNMHPETMVTYGPWFKKRYNSTKGHIVLRVYSSGSDYEVYILNEENNTVKKYFGPFRSKASSSTKGP